MRRLRVKEGLGQISIGHTLHANILGDLGYQQERGAVDGRGYDYEHGIASQMPFVPSVMKWN